MPVSFSWSLSLDTPLTPTAAPASVDSAFRDFALGPDDDLLLSGGDLVPVSGVEGIASDLRSRLQTFIGECFLDVGLGIPWLQKVLGRKPSPGELSAIFREAILGTPGVATVDSLDTSTAGRTLSIRFKARTATGAALSAALGVDLGGA
jgi:hypothetical protein